MVGQTRLNLRYNLARWFDAHETTGRYLVDADVQRFKELCETFLFLSYMFQLKLFYQFICQWFVCIQI